MDSGEINHIIVLTYLWFSFVWFKVDSSDGCSFMAQKWTWGDSYHTARKPVSNMSFSIYIHSLYEHCQNCQVNTGCHILLQTLQECIDIWVCSFETISYWSYFRIDHHFETISNKLVVPAYRQYIYKEFLFLLIGLFLLP